MSSTNSQNQPLKAGNALSKTSASEAATSHEPFDDAVKVPTTPPRQTFNDAVEPATHPAPHRGYLFASIALTAIAGLLSIASIITGAYAFHIVNTQPSKGDSDSIAQAVIFLMFAFTVAESALCLIAMIACFSLLFARPHAVLIRTPSNGSFVCLCVSIFLLFLFCVYSVVIIPVLAGTVDDRTPPAATCVAPAVRCVALISFFAVLVANSKLYPRDPLY